MSKYFSDKTVSEGNIFDVKMNIDGQTIMLAEWPPYQSYLASATFNELMSRGSSSSAETPTMDSTISNVKPSNTADRA
ncbi:hypothetical protein PHJA_001453000 [Phtheirospermum japonicum]|uniref:Uncharacterized protein n=1 Tax=Phtheirospermum japonicum TaxID=374723 RepID=A0A830BY74_9LAMI|nr:hypothetical protein PHJA_001453000 [Phtheirospermum japonicum]